MQLQYVGCDDWREKTAQQGAKCIIDVYEAGGEIHMTLEEKHVFGLFRKSDVTSNGRPWIVLECTVHERANLSNDDSVRTLSVKPPELY